jgi:hypothetical protein
MIPSSSRFSLNILSQTSTASSLVNSTGHAQSAFEDTQKSQLQIRHALRKAQPNSRKRNERKDRAVKDLAIILGFCCQAGS